MRRTRILSLAVQDLLDGRDFYERRQPGVDEYFLDSLSADIDALALYAGIHEQRFGYYRSLASRFPFAIYYRLNTEEIQVWRILDCRSNPARLRTLLQAT